MSNPLVMKYFGVLILCRTRPAVPITPASSRPSSPGSDAPVQFDPSRPIIVPEDSVLLSIDRIPTYLDHALKALTLHTEARTSFITFVLLELKLLYLHSSALFSYWLPSLLKHQHVALRFLPQEAYEDAAPMNVSPAPDVVTRVFMLFRGVEETDWLVGQRRRSVQTKTCPFGRRSSALTSRRLWTQSCTVC